MIVHLRESSGRTRFRLRPSDHRRRRGAALILAAFLMAILVGMLAFSIDIGYIAASRTEAHRTADAAALSGGWQMVDSLRKSEQPTTLQQNVHQVAQQYAGQNVVCSHSPSLAVSGDNTDITLGYMSSLSHSAPIVNNANNPFRAVRVRIRKTQQANGQVPLYFARIFGQTGRDLTVESTAALAVQIKGFSTPLPGSSNIDLLPFALDLQTWNAMKAGGGTDNFRWTGSGVTTGSDGMREMNLYPQGTGSPGNRGTVDIGGSNNSTNDIARQIVHGISSEDLAELGKPLVLDGSGTMILEGDTGISAGVKDELASIIGQERVIPIFSSVQGNGNNAKYNICQWVGVRILHVKLTGAMNQKQVMVQPTGLVVKNVIPGDSTRVWSEGIYSPVVLVK
ncbi:MAG: pilus assembly protein TadG-related protein [Pirellula sp.]|nr:pilus assembly protein TadG-related protein [Pirellula sp.]